MARISHYSFGRMVIDGGEYRSDVIIFPDGRIQGAWRRMKGHALCAGDIAELMASGPSMIIAGTGFAGLMKPDKELPAECRKQGIEFVAAPTAKAVALFDSAPGPKGVAACFHLTC
jgi:hypothetical protein